MKNRKNKVLSIISLMRRQSVKTFIRGERLNFTYVLILQIARFFGKHVLHCNDIDPFVTLMGNVKWVPILLCRVASGNIAGWGTSR